MGKTDWKEWERGLEKAAEKIRKQLQDFDDYFISKYSKELCKWGFWSKEGQDLYWKEYKEYMRTHK